MGEPVALDLVNTLVPPAYGGDLLETPQQVDAWLLAEAERMPGAALQAEPPLVKALYRLRTTLHTLFAAVLDGAEPSPTVLAQVNAASRGAAVYTSLQWPAGGAPIIRLAHRPDGPAEVVIAEVARSAISLLGGPDRQRLRRCEGPGCVLLFVAPHPRLRCCAPHLCGNRVRVARHCRRPRGS